MPALPSVTPTPTNQHNVPTYWNRIATVLETHCTKCHARGGIGPMPLTTFAEAREHAPRMVTETKARRMPPWLPGTAECAPLRHSRALPREDIDALADWSAGGTPEGNPADHRPLAKEGTFAEVTGAPDLVASPDVPYMPKRDRADDYHCFVIDPKLTKNERVTALRVVPGEASIVHHAVLFEVRGRTLEKIEALDAADPDPGFKCFGGIGPIGVKPTVRAGKPDSGQLVDFDSQLIVLWTPGSGATDLAGAPTPLPKGTAIQLAAGSRFVMQVHYSLENYQPAMTDRTRVEMWFPKADDVKRQAIWMPVAKEAFQVPPGVGPDDPRAKATGVVDMPVPVTVLGVLPHMHLRGRSTRIEGIDDGNDRSAASCLLDVPRWDFHHQEAYWLRSGVTLRRAAVTCNWDNRDEAQPVTNGRRRPTRSLYWGEGTDDEMCLAYLYTVL